MTEEKLTISDRNVLKLNIKVSIVLGVLFLVAVLLFIIITFVVGTVFNVHLKEGFIMRASYIFGIFFLLFCFVWGSYFKYYVDLVKGIKVTLNLTNYKIETEKDKSFIISDTPYYERIEIYEGYIPFIDVNRPLKIQLAKESKEIVFVSNDKDNYLDKPL